MTSIQHITVPDAEADQRLDRWFKRRFPQVGHVQLEKLLRTGQVRVDGKRVDAATRVAAGQVIRIPPLPEALPTPTGPRRRIDPSMVKDLKQRVLHRDAAVLVLDKPAGLAVQGGSGTTLHLDGMLDELRFDSEERPRLVHRLDRDTSGVLVLARTAKAAAALARAFKHKDAEKTYWAIVVGVPTIHSGTIDANLSKTGGQYERIAVTDDGDRAITHYDVLDHAHKRAALLALMPVTGRTHQLRVHCAAMGTPILGDVKYGGAKAVIEGVELARQLHLHARRLRIPNPAGGWLEVTAPPPRHLKQSLDTLGLKP
ncbi:MAG: RluA family pseudouridine synthase [Alphaproteobacteria bacterium]|nr:RluA family pseudouridine synthase [Alphaproteobacteria bacterium]